MNLKELATIDAGLAPGHRLCPGCGAAIIANIVQRVARAKGYELVVANATGCLEVATTIYPYTSWRIPWIHNAFENAAATISGVESAYKVLKKKGRVKKDNIRFVVFGGDGGSYDIGLQSMSGAFERRHKFLYIVYDNEAYMNTGIQRSSATPLGAWTTTTPIGSTHRGKEVERKDLTMIAAAHRLPYVAQASIAFLPDLVRKIEKALDVDGPSFINILSTCPRGWYFDPADTLKVARMAVETNFWPLFEVVNGRFILNYEPKERKPITEWIKLQGRYKHLWEDTPQNREIIARIQRDIDERFNYIKRLASLHE